VFPWACWRRWPTSVSSATSTAKRASGDAFSFHGSVGAFYKAVVIGLGLWLGGLVVIFVGFGGLMLISLPSPAQAEAAGADVLACLGFLAIPLWMTLMQNLVWNNTRLGEHRFGRMRWGRTAFIVFTNILGIAFTLGLFTPFARIRLLRYRIESLTLLPASGLDDFIASSEAHGSATGEGLGDLLDRPVDVSQDGQGFLLRRQDLAASQVTLTVVDGMARCAAWSSAIARFAIARVERFKRAVRRSASPTAPIWKSSMPGLSRSAADRSPRHWWCGCSKLAPCPDRLRSPDRGGGTGYLYLLPLAARHRGGAAGAGGSQIGRGTLEFLDAQCWPPASWTCAGRPPSGAFRL
jgi:hypothetical protein